MQLWVQTIWKPLVLYSTVLKYLYFDISISSLFIFLIHYRWEESILVFILQHLFLTCSL